MRAGWRAVATALSVLTAILIAIVITQASMLHDRGWRIDLGTLPEWISAAGLLVALSALLIAADEWRDHNRQRLDSQADQARLIVAQPVAIERGEEWLTIVNHSNKPIFNLDVEPYLGQERAADLGLDPGIAVEYELILIRDRRVQGEFFREPVLAGGDATPSPFVVVAGIVSARGPVAISSSTVELIRFDYTDADGRRWQRTGSAQPVRVYTGLGS